MLIHHCKIMRCVFNLCRDTVKLSFTSRTGLAAEYSSCDNTRKKRWYTLRNHSSPVYFPQNKCFPCPSEGCPQMGHYADRFPGKTKEVGQTFYLNTGDVGNFPRKSLFDWPSILNADFTHGIMPSEKVWNSFSVQNIFKHSPPPPDVENYPDAVLS